MSGLRDHDRVIAALDPRVDDPATRTRVSVTVPGWLVDGYERDYRHKFWEFMCLKSVLDNPLRIYRNTRNLGHQYWGYVGRPDFMYDPNGRREPFPSGYLYAVYVNADLFVHDFAFEKADPNDGTHVSGHAVRMGESAWAR